MNEIPIRTFNATTPEQFRQVLQGPADQAARWMATAAEHGVLEAQVHYGQMLLDGRGVKRDAGQAFQWFRLAANADHVMAMNMTGRCYENGWGVQHDLIMANYWFKLAAERGLDWGMYNYATSLALGRGLPQDRGQALRWLLRATALGHAKSWNLLGGFHEDGWEVDADLDKAMECYRNAAEGGDFRGQFNYSRLLAEQNRMREAIDWMRRVPETATAAFMHKTRLFLAGSRHYAFRALSASHLFQP